MITHKTNFYETLLPEAHRTLIRDARRELTNLAAPLACKYNNPEVTAVWELVTSGANEYTVTLKDIYSNIPKLTAQLQSYLKNPLMGYLALPLNFQLDHILKERSEGDNLSEQTPEDKDTKPC